MVAMKKVLYLALAVVATAFATSCVKELADGNQENTGNKPEIEITGQVFEAKMEATKSVIDGKTPTWVEGDAISVFGSNETTGIECTFAGEGKFQVNGDKVVEGPFYAIYPHKEGHSVDQSTGIFTATVPAEQLIKAGENTAAGALVAVAASETPEFYFRNAVGLVRLENKREDIVSIKIESTNAEQMLAGSFTMDLNPDKDAENEAPAVTPATEGGSASVTLKSAEENGVLASGVYYAAILPGKIDGIKVTFTRKNGEKTEPVTVTKAKETTIPRNGGADLGAFFAYEIKNAKELLAWNKAAAKWTAWDVVTLNSDTGVIDCSEINSDEWTVRNFSGILDGNNQTIDNLVIEKTGAASFLGRATGYAVIKNLTFGAGCSFTVTGTTGADGMNQFAKNRTYAASVLSEASEHTCLINITNNGTITATAGSATNGNYFAGVCASHDGLEAINGCKNYGSVTVLGTPSCWTNISGVFGQITKQVTATGCENHGDVQFKGTNSNNVRLNMGGMCGGIGDVINFADCKNLGNISCNATEKHSGNVHIGGLVGYVDKNIIGTMSNCSNGSATDATKGALSNNAECGARNNNTVTIGGCIGFINGKNASISNFKNYGQISNTKSVNTTLALGGIVGQINQATENSITVCENHGLITNNVALTENAYFGGIVGWLNAANTSIANVTNKGAISNTNISSNSKIICVGGIVGCASSGNGNSITNATNEGEIKPYNKDSKAYPYAGGIVGYIDSGSTNIGDETENGVINKGNIIWSGKAYDIGIGGIVGKIRANGSNVIKNCKNTGNLSHTSWLDDPQKQSHGLGGILGSHVIIDETTVVTLGINNCANEGNINKTGGSVGHIHMGGIAGSLGATSYTATSTVTAPKLTDTFNSGKGTATISNCNNNGNLSNVWTTAGGNKHSYTGGIAGFFNYDGSLNGCINEGSITSNVYSTSGNLPMCLGGIVGRSAASTITNCTNNGLVSELSASCTGCVGGIVGYVLKTRTVKLTNCDNTKEIIGTFSSNGDFRVGGIVGMSHNSITMENCDNTGNVTSKTTQTANTQFIGGIIGQSENNLAAIIINCSCKATVTPSTTLSNAYSGMIGGRITDKNNPKISSVTGTTVSGTFAGNKLTAENYGTYTFGTSSDYGKKSGHATTGITFAE